MCTCMADKCNNSCHFDLTSLNAAPVCKQAVSEHTAEQDLDLALTKYAAEKPNIVTEQTKTQNQKASALLWCEGDLK